MQLKFYFLNHVLYKNIVIIYRAGTNENDKIAALAFRGLSWGLVAKGMVDEAVEMEQKARSMLLEIFGGNKKHNQYASALR